MRKKKKRNSKVRTFPGDRKPAKSVSKDKMFYETKLSKWQGKMRWLVIERPTGSILRVAHFDDGRSKKHHCLYAFAFYGEKYRKNG